MATKRTGKKGKKGKAGEDANDENVVRLDVKRAEKTLSQVDSLMGAIARGIDEGVGLIVGAYHEWESENPKHSLGQLDKMSMVRLGFIGRAGFDRCHQGGRLPTGAYISADGDLAEDVLDDAIGCETLMCPAMESRKCQGIWKHMGIPPCELLLLEVYLGLGGGVYDDRVNLILEDYSQGFLTSPESRAKSFAKAERLLRKYP